MDVAIVGAGPAGLACAYYLVKAQKKVAVFERGISVGGGMWAGGMMFNKIVVQEKAKRILDELRIKTVFYQKGYYLADSIEAVCGLGFSATQKGAEVFNLISCEDVMVRNRRISGLVINWSAVEMSKLHVDPLTIRAKFVVDATGHAAEVVHIAERKSGIKLQTKTGKILGERSLNAHLAEEAIVKNSRQILPGLYVCGMCANAVFGSPRMGPIFGGMLLSGRKVALELVKHL